jgi:hypothetical protein
LLVVENCAALGGLSNLNDESCAWMLEKVVGLPFTIKKSILERAIRAKKIILIRLSLARFEDLELSQHTSTIETLMHEIKSGDFDEDLKEIAKNMRDRANLSSSLSLDDWMNTKEK